MAEPTVIERMAQAHHDNAIVSPKWAELEDDQRRWKCGDMLAAVREFHSWLLSVPDLNARRFTAAYVKGLIEQHENVRR